MYNYDLIREFNWNTMEILHIGDHYEVWDYDGFVLFEGTEAECADYIDENSDSDSDSEEYQEV